MVHKRPRSKGRVVKVERTIVLGYKDRIILRLENSKSKTINTSFVEHSNLTWRMMNVPLCRKTLCFPKWLRWLRARFSFVIAVYNFVRSHISLSAIKYPVTAAMAAKITENRGQWNNCSVTQLIVNVYMNYNRLCRIKNFR
jgi:hypothetical protein